MASTLSTTQNVILPDIPELFDSQFLDILLPPVIHDADVKMSAADTGLINPMMEALKATVNQTYTENGAPAYASTLSPTLDAFQGMSGDTYGARVNDYLANAWEEDPGLTLRIIWNVRSIHDGKGEKELFYRAFGWLYDHHPRTAILNLHLLVEPVCTTPKAAYSSAHGYWKDLLNILALATVDELSTINHPPSFLHAPRAKYTYTEKSTAKEGQPAVRIKASKERGARDRAAAKEERARVSAERYDRLIGKLAQPKYRALYVAIARLFADRLTQDLQIVSKIEALQPGINHAHVLLLKHISLAGKWAPTPNGSHDRTTNIATAIALLLHRAQALSVFPSALATPLNPKEFAVILRSFFQRWVLMPLRRITLVPEPLMVANKWKEIKYNRVPSISMANNTGHFLRHDPDGFQKYLIAVESGRKKISGATLLPHELVAHAIKFGKAIDGLRERNGGHSEIRALKAALAETNLRVVEAQWKTLIARLRESGAVESALALCDVSGSMGSLHMYSKQCVSPIFPAVALSLILATLAKPPFNGGFITFSGTPKFVQLDLTKSLHEIVVDMVTTGWEMNTDLHAVFMNLLLPLAIANNVKQEDMIKRLFVFSDMQFDDCHGSSKDAANWQTNHDVIERRYREAGYAVPEIVYWNLNGDSKVGRPQVVEVMAERKGVAMMSGFSPAMLKVFMGEEVDDEWEKVDEKGENAEQEFNPVNVMKRALMVKSFDGLMVAD